ncbi:DUF6443 domain-containing protein [uncultured Croceitalea sp.]|uniref:Ig-like domain-containing protein n=1 Tax=uncultured Croceitalea sp. TaxID=1798908 RepID=UPI003306754A
MKKIYILVLILFMANHLVGQNCQIVFTSPNSHNFSASGGTIDINVQYSTTQCEEGISNKPSWISSATFLNRNTLRLVASSNSGPARSGTVTITVNSGSTSNISVSQATNAVPPGTPSVTGDSRCGSGSVTLTANPGSGGNAIRWYENSSGGSVISSSTSLTRTISTTRNYYAASYNTSTQLYSSRVAVLAQVTTPPTPLLGNAPSACSGASGTGSAQSLNSDGVTSHIWYTAASGGSVVSGVAQNTAPGSGYYISSLTRTITTTTTYYVAAVCNGLESSARRAVTFTLDNAPQITIGVSGGAQTSYCPGETVTLLAQGGSNYQWRRGSATGTILSTSTSFGVTASDTYYLTGTRSCGATQTRSIVISFQAPATPTPPTITNNCGNTVLTKTSAPSGFTYYWQSTASGTATSGSAAAQSITRTGGSVYYLRARNNSTACWSPARTVNYAIDAVPNTPTNATGDSRCGSGSVTVSATPGSGGNTIRWYTASSGGSVLDAGLSLTRTVSTTTTYYAETYNSTTQCASSSRLAVQASVGAPAAPQEVSNSGCSGESGPISARSTSPDVTEHRWYNNVSGGTAISGIAQDTAPGSGSYISTLTKTFTQTETYYVAAVCNGEESSTRTAVTYTVTSAPNITIGVSGGVQPQYCASTVTLLAQGGSGYQWRQGSATGNIISSGTSLAVTSSDTYFLTGNRDCGATQTTSINIVFANLSTPSIQSIVENCGSTIVTMNNAPTGEVWHWQSTIDGTDQTAASVEQIRTFTAHEPLFLRSRAEFTDCWGPAIPIDYTVRLTPNAPSGDDVVQCGNDPFDIFATIGPDADTINWYTSATGGTAFHEGMFYRVINGSGTTSYFVESYNSATGCASATRTEIQATILSGQTPSAPFGENIPFCGETAVTFTVSQPTGVDEIRWYDSVTKENLVGTGTTYTTPLISVTTTYFVEGVNTSTGCTSGLKSIQAQLGTETVWYLDADQDGLGDPANATTPTCVQPQGYVGNANDECPDVYSPTNYCNSDPADQNYVYTRTYEIPSTTTIDANFFTANNALIQDITYIDGLGRPLQQIAIDQSPQQNDIVTPIEYDDFGRIKKEWLSYPTTDDALATLRFTAKNDALTYYDQSKYENTQNPFSESAFEASPLNRVKQQAAPGDDWALDQGHEIEFEYQTNTATDAVKQFEISIDVLTNNTVITYESTLVENGEYITGELFKSIVYDENHTVDQDHSTEEYTDKSGRVVLKRTFNNEEPHDTYYIYDDFGNLSFVLPPLIDVSDGVSQTELDELGYQYTYDHRNRMVIKKIPGKGEEHIVYNRLDQPIMTQDPNLRTNGEWLFTKYDAFGRVAYTGMVDNSLTRTALQNNANNSATELWVEPTATSFITIDNINVYYTNDGYPNASYKELHTVNYYDRYDTARDGMPISVSAFGVTNITEVQGMPTVNLVKVLGTSHIVTSASYYDAKGRVIYYRSDNTYLGTVDIKTSQLDFVGRPLKTRTAHARNGNTVVTIDNFSYDHIGRLLTQTQCVGDATLGNSCPASGGSAPIDLILENTTITSDQLATNSVTLQPIATVSGTATLSVDPNATGGTGSATELIVYNKYDELGQLQAKKVGGIPSNDYGSTTGLQTVDYTYNVRGWLTGINDADDTDATLTKTVDKLFGFRIGYNEGPNALYNGNIALTQWQSQNQDTGVKDYNYAYDALNRITAATDNTGNFNLSNINYDKNGNIETLKREGWISANPSLTNNSGFGTMDNLTYDYDSGNKLINVADNNASETYGFKDVNGSGIEYQYDQNGNMTSDANKGITAITYNHLNLPKSVTFDNSSTKNIEYIYDAIGTKLEKKVNDNGTLTNTLYAGNFIYQGNDLRSFNHSEGYAEPKNASNYHSGFDYVYQYKDHLDNVRLTYSDSNNDGSINPNTEIISEKHYYPFGMTHSGYNNVISAKANSQAEKYRYNGKELEESLGLNWHDYGARRYDASLGRFMTLDPFAEKYSPQSAFAYAANNPIMYVDVFGLGPGDPPYTKNNVTFIHFNAPTISVVNRQSGGTFTSAAIAADNSSVKNEYVVNMQQYETLSYMARAKYIAGSNIDVSDVRTQGLTIVDGAAQEGGRTSNSYYVAQCIDGSCQAGLGDPPSDAKIGFGGGIPLLVDGMSFGAEKKYDSNGNMIQNSSAGFKAQNKNSKTLGKTILAFDNNGNFMIVSQQNGVEGMTLAAIRDHLKSKGYTNAISFDGSTSSTLVKDNKVINKPDKRKNNSIPVGAKINE